MTAVAATTPTLTPAAPPRAGAAKHTATEPAKPDYWPGRVIVGGVLGITAGIMGTMIGVTMLAASSRIHLPEPVAMRLGFGIGLASAGVVGGFGGRYIGDALTDWSHPS